MDERRGFEDLESIFRRAVESVNPEILISEQLHMRDNVLHIGPAQGSLDIDLADVTRLVIVGAGKATARMAKAVEHICGSRIDQGLICVKYGHTEPLSVIETVEAGHPVPDENSERGAARILEIADRADEGTLMLNLISGGGSALLAAPVSLSIGNERFSLTLEELQQTTEVLLGSGAAIEEINCIRKHLSAIKGGRLAERASPALLVNLILSDVIGDRLDTIASGPTTFDSTTYTQALDILNRYGIEKSLPKRVLHTLQAGASGLTPETPKKGAALFNRVHNIILGNNYRALQHGVKEARRLGYNVVPLSSRIAGEAREAARVFAGIAKDVKERGILAEKPACIIWGGETTVTLSGPGRGGRNQEFALSFLLELQEYASEHESGILLLAASTDGNDGPTDAAGAFASYGVLSKAAALSLDPIRFLKNNDSYSFFDKTGFLLRTGPTNTNVCDLQIALVS
jgi:hydroxypyruvate reductase